MEVGGGQVRGERQRQCEGKQGGENERRRKGRTDSTRERERVREREATPSGTGSLSVGARVGTTFFVVYFEAVCVKLNVNVVRLNQNKLSQRIC